MENLSNEEKISIANAILKSYQDREYQLQLEKNAEEQIEMPNSLFIDNYNQQLLDISAKINYIENIINGLLND